MLLAISTTAILTSVVVFLIIILLLVVVLLFAKAKLVKVGNVEVTVNDDKTYTVPMGGTLLNTLQNQGIFLSSACGGKGSCGQCRCQVMEGGGEILATEVPHFSRREIKNDWRLSCQVKVKDDMKVRVPESVFGVKEWDCTVVSNHNVASFIKEFVVALPKGEHMDFKPGSYAQITIPEYDISYSTMEVDEKFKGEWDKFKLWPLTAPASHRPTSSISSRVTRCASAVLTETSTSMRTLMPR